MRCASTPNGFRPMRLARCHERVPKRFAVACGAVNFVAQLADEAHAEDADRNTGEHARADAHVGECLLREIDVGCQLLDHGAGLGAGKVDRRVGGRDVGDVDIHLPLRIEPRHRRGTLDRRRWSWP